MKKTNFLKGLAAVVLGCMFTSCEKEDLNATFQPKPASATLKVTVIDGLTVETITDKAQITVSGANFVAQTNPGEFLLAPATGGINKTPITISAELGDAQATVQMNIGEVKAGGKANYDATLILAAGLEFNGVEGDAVETDYYATFDNLKHDASHTHAGWSNWYVNKSDYFQPWTVTYEVAHNVLKAENFVEGEIFDNLNESNQTTIKNIYNAWNNLQIGKKETLKLEGKASAWSYFNVKVTRTTKTTKWEVTDNATDKVAATYDVTAISGTKAEPIEFAAPGHEGHYQHGHGHGHGNNSNAGGGISIAE